MKEKCYSKRMREYGLMIIGTCLMAVATISVFEPMELVPGGVTGLSIIVKTNTRNMLAWFPDGIPIWITNVLCNIPLFVWGIFKKGKSFMRRSFTAFLLSSVFLALLPRFPVLTNDRLLDTIIGGILMGVGLGMVFVTDTSTGGTDLLAVLLQCRFPYFAVGTLLGIVDAGVVTLGAVTFGIKNAIYAVVVIWLVSRISNRMIDGMRHSKMVYIITIDAELVAKAVMEELGRGVTRLEATGMYTRENKGMLLCVVSPKQIVQLKQMVMKIDEKAFIIVEDVRETLGEGFGIYRA